MHAETKRRPEIRGAVLILGASCSPKEHPRERANARSREEMSNQGIMDETARFTRRRARFIIDVFLAVFLRLVAVRVVLRLRVVVFFAAAFFLLLAIRASSVEGSRMNQIRFRRLLPDDRQGAIQPATRGGTVAP
jgi:hypothetical protein